MTCNIPALEDRDNTPPPWLHNRHQALGEPAIIIFGQEVVEVILVAIKARRDEQKIGSKLVELSQKLGVVG